MKSRLIVALAACAASPLMFGASAQPDTSDPSFEWAALGASTYSANCAACHGQQGAGTPGAFPPLAGHVPDFINVEGGRELLADIVLYGLAGEIEVQGSMYNGSMPPWGQLGDDEVAAVLNHIATAWGNVDELDEGVVLFGPKDVSAERAKDLNPTEVFDVRRGVIGSAANDTDAAAEAGDAADPGMTHVVDDETGYFTAEQAERGNVAYAEHCAHCHGPTMRGGLHDPPITNLGFFRTWGGRTFDTLFSYIQAQMPLDDPGGLRTSDYVDIAAFWLETNAYPSGDVPLNADPEHLRQIEIERR